jgi:hypothetical protein
MNMSNVVINGVRISGNSIVVSNGKVIIDGKDVTPEAKVININVEGDVDDISVDMCQKIIVAGVVKNIKTTSGDIECGGSVGGNVQTTSGDIECADVNGDVNTTSGDVKCGTVAGSVKTLSGDIKSKK